MGLERRRNDLARVVQMDSARRGARCAPTERRPVTRIDADCLTNTPSQPLPLTLESDGPAAAPLPSVGRIGQGSRRSEP